MTDAHTFLTRARAMLDLAESVDAAIPGAAGLAYQAANLALFVRLLETDGADPWAHDAHNRRASELTGISAEDLAFLHSVRMLDFYAGSTFTASSAGGAWSGPLQAPSPEDCRRAVSIARRSVDAVATALDHPSEETLAP